MPDVVFYDCESDSTLAQCGHNFDQCQATCVCAIAIDADLILRCASEPSEIEYILKEHSKQAVFWRDEAEKGHDPFETLLRWFDEAEAIVAYNGLHFDFPLLKKHYGRNGGQRYFAHRCKTLDSYKLILAATDQSIGLNALLQANGFETKTGSGLEAIQWWHEGKRMKLRSYCMQDVKVMARLVMQNTIKTPPSIQR